MSDSDVFIISAIRATDSTEAIRQAVEKAEVQPSRVQDVVFGLDETRSLNTEEIARGAGLNCPTVIVSPSLRAVFFAAQSILSEDVGVVIVTIVDEESSLALLLASPDAIGRWNLLPRARLAARSLSGVGPVLQATGITPEDISITKDKASLIGELIDELEEKSARWGVISTDGLALLVERI